MDVNSLFDYHSLRRYLKTNRQTDFDHLIRFIEKKVKKSLKNDLSYK